MYIKWRFYFEQNKRKSNNKSALANKKCTHTCPGQTSKL